MQKCVNERRVSQKVTPIVRIEMDVAGSALLIADAADINVDPVVQTSSMRSIPLFASEEGSGSENIPEVLSRRCCSVIDVCVLWGRDAFRAVETGIPVASEIPFAIWKVWLYPRRACLKKCMGTGRIMSVSAKNPEANSSSPAILPSISPMPGKRRYFMSCISMERADPRV